MASTDVNKHQQSALVTGMDLDAVKFRFDGLPYRSIEMELYKIYGELAPREQTIRLWFSSGGRLREYYDGYVANETAVRHKEALDIFKAHLPTAVRTLVGAMNDKSGMVRIMAAERIINRQLGDPVKVIANIKEDSPVRRLLRSRGIIDNKDDTGETTGNS